MDSPSERSNGSPGAAWKLVAVPRAIRGDGTRPLRIGNLELPCFVLEDDRRVLLQRPFLAAIGLDAATEEVGAFRLGRLVAFLAGKQIDVKELAQKTRAPIAFQQPNSTAIAFGYEASVLTEICDAVIKARTRGLLTQAQHLQTAARCNQLLGLLAREGLVVLLDQATSGASPSPGNPEAAASPSHAVPSARNGEATPSVSNGDTVPSTEQGEAAIQDVRVEPRVPIGEATV